MVGKEGVGAEVKEETIQQANPAFMFEETLIPKPILSTGIGG